MVGRQKAKTTPTFRSMAALLSLYLGRCSGDGVLFKRVVPSGHSDYGLYSQIAQVSGSVSLTHCAAMTIKTWDVDPATPAANAIRHRKATGVCDYGTVPKTPFGDLAELDPTEDDEGIYLIQKCLELELKYTDVFMIAPLTEGKEGKYLDSAKVERDFGSWNHNGGGSCGELPLAQVRFGLLRAYTGHCSLIKYAAMAPTEHSFTEVTVMLWAYVTASTVGDSLIGVTQSGNWNTGFWFRIATAGAPQLSVWQGVAVLEHTATGTGPAVQQGAWTHVAATYTLAEGKVRFYLDGEISGDAVDIGTVAIADPLSVMAFYGCVNTGSCAVADGRIYKSALSPETVRTLYETSKPVECPLL